MGLILKHLLRESSKEKKDQYVLNKLNAINERGTITFAEWKESGRFVGRDSFLDDHPKEDLHVDCTDIVTYYGDIFIQALKTGVFYLGPDDNSKLLDEMEKKLWSQCSEKLWG